MDSAIENDVILDTKISPKESNQTGQTSVKPARKSGIELLKIIAIFLIVLTHTIDTLHGWGQVDSSLLGDWVIEFSKPGSGVTNLILSILYYGGQLGNVIFIVCSSWFLLDKTTSNKKKLLRIFVDVFLFSVVYLIIIGCCLGFKTLTIKEIIKSFFPNYFANNWFITSYFAFALIVPILNRVIKTFSKEVHFVVSLVLFGLFFIAGFIVPPAFSNTLIAWVAIYFIIAYFKLYGHNFCTSKKINISLVVTGIIGIIAVTSLTYIIGSKTSLLKNSTRWSNVYCPFFLFIAFGGLNLFNRTKFSSKFINYISSLSFLIYIIHENLLFRHYIRAKIWNLIYINFGYDLLFVWIAIYTVTLFIVATLIAALYNLTLQKLVHKLSDKIYNLLVRLIAWSQTKLIKVIK